MGHDSGDIGRVSPRRRVTWVDDALKSPVRATVDVDVNYPAQGKAYLELWMPTQGWSEICARYGEELVFKDRRVSGHGFSAHDTDNIIESMRVEACELLGLHPYPDDEAENDVD